MRRILPGILMVAALVVGISPARADVTVVATVPDLAAIVREIGGSSVRVVSLAAPTQDPHFVDAKPNLALKLAKADLLVYVGLDLEVGWLPTLIVGSRNASIQAGAKGNLDCSKFVELLDVPAQKIERSMGDIHPGGNPHYLHDPRRALAVAAGIAARLQEIDPVNATAYASGLESFRGKLGARIAGWAKRMEPWKGTRIVTYHKSFVYVENWLGLQTVEHVEPKPGIPPNPRHVLDVIQAAKTSGAKVLLQETYYPAQTSMTIAEKSGLRVVAVSAGADSEGGQSYGDRVEAMVNALESALKGGGA
ncbi:MAG: zinc ABC transporter substrate-binding protein [Deltaproteobacteria bacterium]|nr:zinc ABC transporter substrate-binding protein [Deltaproteobacteria bacterium]